MRTAPPIRIDGHANGCHWYGPMAKPSECTCGRLLQLERETEMRRHEQDHRDELEHWSGVDEVEDDS